MGLDVEYLMLSQRPWKSAPLCSRAEAAPVGSLNSMMAERFWVRGRQLDWRELDIYILHIMGINDEVGSNV